MRPQLARSQELHAGDEIAELRARLAEAEATLAAIRSGEVDALVVSGEHGEQVFTLQGAETPYRFLVEAMNEGALLLSPDGTIVYANATFARLVNTPLAQIITQPCSKFFPPTEHGRLRDLLAIGQSGGCREEFAVQASDGSLTRTQVSVSPLKPDGTDGVGMIVTDLTDRKKIEHELRQTIGDLEAFSYSISHDMRAPLRAVQGFLAIVLETAGSKLTEQEKEHLSRSIAATNRLDQLIRDVLRYSRTARSELMLTKVDAGKLINHLIETYPNLADANAKITINGEIPPVLAHEALLSQCIFNLLDNALKFVPENTAPAVRISALKDGGNVRIKFSDNGIGIEPRHQERIFQIFERVHPVETYGGTGIGLSIVKKAVQRMGGTIGVESEVGKGATFWIQLPAAEA
jgi:PAS domain S-box-containing protein